MRSRRSIVVAVAIVAFYALHHDLWWWRDARTIAGLPIGLAYHVLTCFVATLGFALLVRYAWPHHLRSEADE